MSLLRPCPSASFSSFHSRIHFIISKPLVSRTLIPVTLKKFSTSVSASSKSSDPSIQGSTDSSSSVKSDAFSPIGVFIKGLPLSTAEGRLKKAFSQFGEVAKVELVVDKRSKQPSGSGFVWFTSEESANLAVKEMNGKFFDGRFILVKIAEPNSSNNKGRRTRYKF